MRLPRDISGEELASLLHRHYGYTVVRQRGSHMRLTAISAQGNEHHVSIPRHNPIRVGTLNRILADVGLHLGVDQEDIILKLFVR